MRSTSHPTKRGHKEYQTVVAAANGRVRADKQCCRCRGQGRDGRDKRHDRPALDAVLDMEQGDVLVGLPR